MGNINTVIDRAREARYTQIIEMVGNKMRNVDIARALGLTRQRIGQIIKRMRKDGLL